MNRQADVLKRVDIKAILADPVKRRKLMVSTIMALQMREGIEISKAQAEAAYDAMLSDQRKEVLKEVLGKVKGIRACPFDHARNCEKLEPTDRCPVCGDLGTAGAADEPSKCQSPEWMIEEMVLEA